MLYLGGVNHFLFSPLPEEIIQFDEHFWKNGWFNHQLDIDSAAHVIHIMVVVQNFPFKTRNFAQKKSAGDKRRGICPVVKGGAISDTQSIYSY